MMNDFSQNTNTLYPSYEDEEYWRYLIEEAEWYGKQEDAGIFFQQNILGENHMGMDEIVH